MEERRMFQRFAVDFSVKYLNLDTNKEGTGKMVNISAAGGGMVLTKELFPVPSSLQMQFLIPDNREPLSVTGRVIWSKMIEPDKYMAGIQFDEVDFMGIARALKLGSTS